MAPGDILALLHNVPFNPFRMVTTDGTTYEVTHPDLVRVGLASCFVGYPHHANQAIYERFDMVSTRHIIRLEPNPIQVSQADNGQG